MHSSLTSGHVQSHNIVERQRAGVVSGQACNTAPELRLPHVGNDLLDLRSHRRCNSDEHDVSTGCQITPQPHDARVRTTGSAVRLVDRSHEPVVGSSWLPFRRFPTHARACSSSKSFGCLFERLTDHRVSISRHLFAIKPRAAFHHEHGCAGLCQDTRGNRTSGSAADDEVVIVPDLTDGPLRGKLDVRCVVRHLAREGSVPDLGLRAGIAIRVERQRVGVMIIHSGTCWLNGVQPAHCVAMTSSGDSRNGQKRRPLTVSF